MRKYMARGQHIETDFQGMKLQLAQVHTLIMNMTQYLPGGILLAPVLAHIP